MLVTLNFGVSKIMFKTFKEQRFCNKYNLKTKKNIPEVIERVIGVYRKRKATCLLLLIGNERCTRCSSPAPLIFRSSHSFTTLSSPALYFFSIENDQIINSAEADAAVDTTYVVV
jgi:hypothetical protein